MLDTVRPWKKTVASRKPTMGCQCETRQALKLTMGGLGLAMRSTRLDDWRGHSGVLGQMGAAPPRKQLKPRMVAAIKNPDTASLKADHDGDQSHRDSIMGLLLTDRHVEPPHIS